MEERLNHRYAEVLSPSTLCEMFLNLLIGELFLVWEKRYEKKKAISTLPLLVWTQR